MGYSISFYRRGGATLWDKADAVAHAENMGVDGHCLASKGNGKHYIGGLAAYAGQGCHILHCVWNSASKTVAYHAGHSGKML